MLLLWCSQIYEQGIHKNGNKNGFVISFEKFRGNRYNAVYQEAYYDNGVKGKFRFIDPYHTYWLHNNRLLLTDRGLTYLLSGEYINGQPYFFDGSKITCDLSTVTFTGFYDCKK